MSRWTFRACLVSVLGILVLLTLPGTYLYVGQTRSVGDEPARTLEQYLKAVYARDYGKAYRFISSRDQRVKGKDVYVRERGTFHGFTLEVAAKLAELIETRPLETHSGNGHTRVRLGFRLPDANSLSPVVLDWDEDRLNALPATEQKQILHSIDSIIQRGELKMITGEQEFALVKENDAWRVLLDWAAGVRVVFDAIVPADGTIEATPLPRQTIIQTGELFTIAYRVKNRSQREVFGRIAHHVEPESLAQHLDLVECALLLPVRLAPGKEEEYSSTYLLRGDLPDGGRNFRVTYEFKVEP